MSADVDNDYFGVEDCSRTFLTPPPPETRKGPNGRSRVKPERVIEEESYIDSQYFGDLDDRFGADRVQQKESAPEERFLHRNDTANRENFRRRLKAGAEEEAPSFFESHYFSGAHIEADDKGTQMAHAASEALSLMQSDFARGAHSRPVLSKEELRKNAQWRWTDAISDEDAGAMDFFSQQMFSRGRKEQLAKEGFPRTNRCQREVLPPKKPATNEHESAVSGAEQRTSHSRNRQSTETLAESRSGAEQRTRLSRNRQSTETSAESRPLKNQPVAGLLTSTPATGLSDIWDTVEPIWTLGKQQMAQLLSTRVIYNDKNLLAFDKPYQLAYSGFGSTQVRIDTLLQSLKQIVSPEAERLCLVKSLDKDLSGVILFAKNALVQTELQDKLAEGLIEQRYRALVTRVPAEKQAIIDVPLVKRLRNQTLIMQALGEQVSKPIKNVLFPKTRYRLINENFGSALLECVIDREVTHQVRAHLGLGLKCAIMGDAKYGGVKPKEGESDFRPRRPPPQTLRQLDLRGGQWYRLPTYLHLKELRIPLDNRGAEKICIEAPLPQFFLFTLRKLKLLTK